MGMAASVLLTLLHIINPALGLIGSVVKFVVDDRGDVWNLAASIVGSTLIEGIDLDFDLQGDADPVVESLVRSVPIVALESGLEAISSQKQAKRLCKYCGSTVTLPIVGLSGEPVCRDCLTNGARRLILPKHSTLDVGMPSTLYIAGQSLLSPSVLQIPAGVISLRAPESFPMVSIWKVNSFREVLSNRVIVPRISKRFLGYSK